MGTQGHGDPGDGPQPAGTLPPPPWRPDPPSLLHWLSASPSASPHWLAKPAAAGRTGSGCVVPPRTRKSGAGDGESRAGGSRWDPFPPLPPPRPSIPLSRSPPSPRPSPRSGVFPRRPPAPPGGPPDPLSSSSPPPVPQEEAAGEPSPIPASIHCFNSALILINLALSSFPSA